jgi:hypothetical protein
MKNSRTLKCLCNSLLLVLVMTAVASAQWTSAALEQVSSSPADDRIECNNLALDEQWDLLFTSLAGNACNDNELYGITYAEDLFFVSGGNNFTTPNKVYVLNSDGSYFADFDQWSSSNAGWKGLTYDGTYLYGCEDNVIRAFDLTGNPVPSMDITLSMYGMEGIAHDPISDNFWAVAAGELYEIDRQGNAYYIMLPYIGATGLAFDDAAPDGPWLWIFCNLGPSQTLIKQFDPVFHNLTGFIYELPLLSGSSFQTSSDLFFTAGFDPDVYVLGGLTQADPIDQIFALEMYPQSTAPGVTVVLTYQSGSPVPASGGSFDFNIAVSNADPAPVTFDIWTMATLPNGNEYGPIINVQDFTAPANWSSNRDRTQAVPASAPPGLYTYDAYVGAYPDEVWDEDHFEFEKLPGDGGGVQEGGWDCWGDGFDDIASQDASPLPAEFTVLEAYPNPFNPRTTINYMLPQADFVKLAVYDLMGRQVALLVDGYRDTGSHEVIFDARNLTSGVYIYRLETSTVSASEKLVLMK